MGVGFWVLFGGLGELLDVDVLLGEWDFDVVVLKGLVDYFFYFCDEFDFFDYEDPDCHVEVYTAVAKAVEHDQHIVAVVHVHDITSVFVGELQIEHGFAQYLSYLFYIYAVSYSYGHFDEFVGIVTCKVTEIVGKERSVKEGHHAIVGGDDLYTLVGDAFHFSLNAVALNPVAHPQTSSHERNAIEEIVEQVLHSEADTCSQSSRDERDARFRYFEQNECENHENAPHGNSDYIISQREVDFVGSHFVFAGFLALSAVAVESE